MNKFNPYPFGYINLKIGLWHIIIIWLREMELKMKRIFALLLVCMLSSNCVLARDYAKLQIKELKHAQKYNTADKYFQNKEISKKYDVSAVRNVNIKDPKILKLSSYEEISDADYKKKMASDEEKYAKIEKSLKANRTDNFNAQAKGEDFNKVYRIAERIIRANNLDYITWRVGIYKDSDTPNAYSTNANYVAISTSLYDTFANNDDALALVIGHEMGHNLLGHQQRKVKTIHSLQKLTRLIKLGNGGAVIAYVAKKRKLLIDAKNMEYAADIEGAKLAAKAGYNLDKGSKLLSFINSLPEYREYDSDHPIGKHRLENFYDNRKYFTEDQWAEIGKYNIYNSEVMPVKVSSDRRSVYIGASEDDASSDLSYRPESMEDVYLRFAYKSYLNGEFNKADGYFNKYFGINSSNAIAYLYASYNSQADYEKTKGKSHLEKAKEYINKAKNLDKNNKYINEQYDELNTL